MSRTRAHEGARGDRPATPGAETLSAHLPDLAYPADKNAILACARRAHMEHRLLARLERLPEQPYKDAADISRALSQMAH